MGHTIPDPLIYVFLSLASHNADVFSPAPPNKTFSVDSKKILRFILLEKKYGINFKVTVTSLSYMHIDILSKHVHLIYIP